MGHCRVHSWDQGMYAYFLTQRWAWLLLSPLVYSAGNRPKAKWAVAEISGVQNYFWVCGQDQSELTTRMWACLLKIALLSLGLHQGFTVSYLDHKALTNALLSMDYGNYYFWGGNTHEGCFILSSCWHHSNFYILIKNILNINWNTIYIQRWVLR